MSESNGQKVEVLSEVQSEKPVKITNRDGTVQDFVVREMLGDQFTTWLDRISQKYKTDDAGKAVTKTGVKESQEEAIELIHLCLYDSADQQVEPDRIRGWPARTRTRLADMCQEVNGLKVGKD